MNTKRKPHPAKDDGNAIESLVKRERSWVSMKMRKSVVVMVSLVLSLIAGEAFVDEDALLAEEDGAKERLRGENCLC